MLHVVSLWDACELIKSVAKLDTIRTSPSSVFADRGKSPSLRPPSVEISQIFVNNSPKKGDMEVEFVWELTAQSPKKLGMDQKNGRDESGTDGLARF